MVFLSREFNKKMAVRMNRNLFDEVRTFTWTISSFSLAHTNFKCRRVDRLSKPSALIANYMRRFHGVSNSGPNFFARFPAGAHCTVRSVNGNTSYQKIVSPGIALSKLRTNFEISIIVSSNIVLRYKLKYTVFYQNVLNLYIFLLLY